MKSKSVKVVVVVPVHVNKRVAQLENYLSDIVSRFIYLCHEQYGLVADDVYSLIGKVIDFGVQNNDAACVKFVMSYYGLITSYKKAIYEIKLLGIWG